MNITTDHRILELLVAEKRKGEERERKKEGKKKKRGKCLPTAAVGFRILRCHHRQCGPNAAAATERQGKGGRKEGKKKKEGEDAPTGRAEFDSSASLP